MGVVQDASGTDCVACTLVLGLSEQYAQVNNRTIDAKFFDDVCKLLPAGVLRSACDGFFLTFGGVIIELFAEKHTADVICASLKLCSGQCHLFPAPRAGLPAAIERARHVVAVRGAPVHLVAQPRVSDDLPKICNLPGVKVLCDLINNFANNHFPVDDLDKVRLVVWRVWRS